MAVGRTCGTHHGSTAIVLDVTLLAYTGWLSSRSPLAPSLLTCLLANSSGAWSFVLLQWLPPTTSGKLMGHPCTPSLAGHFLFWKPISDKFNTSKKRQIRPTEEKTLPQETAPYGQSRPILGPQQQASELSDSV